MRHSLRNAVTALLLALGLFGATPSRAQSSAEAAPDDFAWDNGGSLRNEQWTGSDAARRPGCATDGRGYSARLEDEDSAGRELEEPHDDQPVEVWTGRRPYN